MELLYRDDDLAVFAKPAGLAVHRGWARDRDVALVRARERLGAHVHLVHRLDRGTSGVLVVALRPEVVAAVQRDQAAGLVRKRYVCLVRGVPPEQGRIDHPVPRGEDGDERVEAVTDFTRLFVTEGGYSWVEARPLTGRLHQIRRHLKHISCPLLGDTTYGKGEHNRRMRELHGLHRLALHAAEVALPHPVSGAPLRVVAPLPDDLRGPLLALGVPADLL